MDYIIPFLKELELFKGLDTQGLQHVLGCLEGHVRSFEKKELIYNVGEPMPYAGLVMVGTVVVGLTHLDGNEHNVRPFCRGELFGESFACSPQRLATVQVTALQKSSVLFLKFSNLLENYATQCPYASRMTANLLLSATQSNLQLNEKINLLSLRHIRERILAYLRGCPSTQGRVQLPFNRQEFADFLGVDRSALSRELAKMKGEGLLDYEKNIINMYK